MRVRPTWPEFYTFPRLCEYTIIRASLLVGVWTAWVYEIFWNRRGRVSRCVNLNKTNTTIYMTITHARIIIAVLCWPSSFNHTTPIPPVLRVHIIHHALCTLCVWCCARPGEKWACKKTAGVAARTYFMYFVESSVCVYDVRNTIMWQSRRSRARSRFKAKRQSARSTGYKWCFFCSYHRITTTPSCDGYFQFTRTPANNPLAHKS